MDKIQVMMVQEKQTHGAIKYAEVGADGNVLKMQNSSIGTLYLRKTAFADGAFPITITVQVESSG